MRLRAAERKRRIIARVFRDFAEEFKRFEVAAVAGEFPCVTLGDRVVCGVCRIVVIVVRIERSGVGFVRIYAVYALVLSDDRGGKTGEVEVVCARPRKRRYRRVRHARDEFVKVAHRRRNRPAAFVEKILVVDKSLQTVLERESVIFAVVPLERIDEVVVRSVKKRYRSVVRKFAVLVVNFFR